MNLSITAVYAFICSLFVGQPAQKTPEPIVDTQFQQLFSTILLDNRPKFDALVQNIADKKIILPDGTTPLTFAIEHKKFHFCPELIKADFLAKPQDLDTARLMQTLQQDPLQKEEASSCIHFLEQYLQELNLIEKSNDKKRGKDDVPDDLKHFSILTRTNEYALMQATMNNDIATMVHLMGSRYADPDVSINGQTPIGIAIRESHVDALECLIFHKATLDLADEEKADLYLEILATNTNKKDMFCPGATDQEELHRQRLKNATEISRIIGAELARQMKDLTPAQIEKRFNIPPLPETAPSKQP